MGICLKDISIMWSDSKYWDFWIVTIFDINACLPETFAQNERGGYCI